MPTRSKLKRKQTTTQVAESLEVDPKTVRGWIKKGCPATKPAGPGKSWMLDETEVAAWLKSEGMSGKPGRPAGAGSEQLDDARLRKESAMADNWELRNAQARGDLLERAEVETTAKEQVRAVRSRLMSVGATLASQLEHRSAAEMQGLIDQHMRSVCEAFAAEKKKAFGLPGNV